MNVLHLTALEVAGVISLGGLFGFMVGRALTAPRGTRWFVLVSCLVLVFAIVVILEKSNPVAGGG